MRDLRFPWVAIAALLLSAVEAPGEGIKIIVNASVTGHEVSAQEFKSIFMLERNTLIDGTHVKPVIRKSGETQKAFARQYLGEDENELQRFYNSVVFSGRGTMPRSFGSDAEVLAYVSSTTGAIGYINEETETAGVGILEITGLSPTGERQLISRVEPVYPEELRVRSIGGIVRLKITVSARGDVSNVQLLGGNPVLAAAASSAVVKWRYASASSRTTMKVEIPFGESPE